MSKLSREERLKQLREKSEARIREALEPYEEQSKSHREACEHMLKENTESKPIKKQAHPKRGKLAILLAIRRRKLITKTDYEKYKSTILDGKMVGFKYKLSIGETKTFSSET